MISFNISVSKRDKFYKALLSNQGFQIMPTRFGFVNVKSYENIENENDNVIIHTGYDINIFTNLILQPSYKVNQYLTSYVELSNKLKIKYILIHGPDTIEKYKYFINGLSILKTTYINNIYVIEMPSFRKSLLDTIDDKFKFIKEYFKICVENEFDVCFDTAHLYANGLNVDEMIELMEEFKGHYKFIHLNGNLSDVYTKDKHTFILDDKSKLKDVDKLLKYISKTDIICIMEIKTQNYKLYKKFAEDYKLKIVDEKIHDLLC